MPCLEQTEKLCMVRTWILQVEKVSVSGVPIVGSNFIKFIYKINK